jgi:16S rRNA (guanine527-N7)-methyltransferase
MIKMSKNGNILPALPGLVLSQEAVEMVGRHAELVREWNRFVSLVSSRDADRLIERHVVDSLSLVPVVDHLVGGRGVLLDIGSGSGYPAIPLKIARPEMEMLLIERSDRKVGFLRKAAGVLKFQGVQIRHGEFPTATEGVLPELITARAVEKPERVFPDVLRFVESGAVFLCQSGEPGPDVREKFHVERWQDEWSARGLRRGDLHLVRKR